MTTILRIGLIRRTVLPRVLSHILTWAILAVYAVAAACARIGILEYAEIEEASGVENVGTVVTFTVIFYVGYCEFAPRRSNGHLSGHCPIAPLPLARARPLAPTNRL